MARKNFQLAFLVVVFVNFPARKLIIFMLLHLVLSPFILITTADTLNEGKNNNQASVSDSVAKQQFRSALNVNAKLNYVKTNCTVNGKVTDAIQTNANERKNANGNSILMQSNITEHGKRPYDVNLSTTENASIHNQSRQTNAASHSQRTKRDDRSFNKDGERLLSRKRRYLIFPPGKFSNYICDRYVLMCCLMFCLIFLSSKGSSMQIGTEIRFFLSSFFEISFLDDVFFIKCRKMDLFFLFLVFSCKQFTIHIIRLWVIRTIWFWALRLQWRGNYRVNPFIWTKSYVIHMKWVNCRCCIEMIKM